MSNSLTYIESLDHEGRGIAHVEGKTIFIENTLPYEQVAYQVFKKKNTFELGTATQIVKSSFMRTTPVCPYFGICGGCSLQHLDVQAQIAIKQRILEDNLQRIGNVTPQRILAPIAGPAWHYRHRARLSARFVAKKGGVLVGFHEKRSSFIADMETCHILPSHIAKLIVPLRQMIAHLSINNRLPQVEVAVGDEVDVLVFRNMEALTKVDQSILETFSKQHSTSERSIQVWLQPKGPDSCYPLYPLNTPQLSYQLPEFGITMPYYPTEFTQVNPAMNQVMVSRAMRLLNPQPTERIADMFCGIGNFTLPIARSGAQVMGLEGSTALVRRAQENAKLNHLDQHTTYLEENLFAITPERFNSLGQFDKMLIDPPRDGAIELVKSFQPHNAPKRLIYVSCNPATLARDAAVLVHTQGYQLKAAGVINMFPHTTHVESIAWFEKAQ